MTISFDGAHRIFEMTGLIDRIMPLKEAPAAHRLVAMNEPLGKIVLDPTLT